eukprot:7317327-Ditylum_brightwellii.AAC.1
MVTQKLVFCQQAEPNGGSIFTRSLMCAHHSWRHSGSTKDHGDVFSQHAINRCDEWGEVATLIKTVLE